MMKTLSEEKSTSESLTSSFASSSDNDEASVSGPILTGISESPGPTKEGSSSKEADILAHFFRLWRNIALKCGSWYEKAKENIRMPDLSGLPSFKELLHRNSDKSNFPWPKLLYKNKNEDIEGDLKSGLSQEEKRLIRLSWRCITVGSPKKYIPAYFVFKRIFILAPELREVFSAPDEEQQNSRRFMASNRADSFHHHARVFTDFLDFIVRNIDNLETIVCPAVQKLARKHYAMVRMGFDPKYFPVFEQAILDFVQVSLKNVNRVHQLSISLHSLNSINSSATCSLDMEPTSNNPPSSSNKEATVNNDDKGDNGPNGTSTCGVIVGGRRESIISNIGPADHQDTSGTVLPGSDHHSNNNNNNNRRDSTLTLTNNECLDAVNATMSAWEFLTAYIINTMREVPMQDELKYQDEEPAGQFPSRPQSSATFYSSGHSTASPIADSLN